jgi:hypothetical protein
MCPIRSSDFRDGPYALAARPDSAPATSQIDAVE